MPLIRYIGTKADGERAYIERTGIVWMPGDVREVSAEHAALLLPHTDVWDIAEPPLVSDATGRRVMEPADSIVLSSVALVTEAGLATAKPRKAKKG